MLSFQCPPDVFLTSPLTAIQYSARNDAAFWQNLDRSVFRAEYNLHQSAAVAQMNKQQTSMVAKSIYPTCRSTCSADIVGC
jgi:hypothetical protein